MDKKYIIGLILITVLTSCSRDTAPHPNPILTQLSGPVQFAITDQNKSIIRIDSWMHPTINVYVRIPNSDHQKLITVIQGDISQYGLFKYII